MMATALTNRTVAESYKDLLQVANANAGIDGTLRPVSDGEGTDSALAVSTSEVRVTGFLVLPPAADAAVNGTVTVTATATFTRLTASGVSPAVVGVTARESGTVVVLLNIGSDPFTANDQSAALGTAANRMVLNGGTRVIAAGQSLRLWYDGTLSRWREF